MLLSLLLIRFDSLILARVNPTVSGIPSHYENAILRSGLAKMLGCSVSNRFPDCSEWRQFEPEVILLAVGWYLRFSLSYRDVDWQAAPID